MLEELVWREKLARPGVMSQKFGPVTRDRSRLKMPGSEYQVDRKEYLAGAAATLARHGINEKRVIDAT